MNSENGMPFPPLRGSTSDGHLHTLQSSQFPSGSVNDIVDPSFQIQALAAFLDVLESDIPQDLPTLDQTEANDQSRHLISSSSTYQQEAQNLVATTGTTEYDSSCSFNNSESMADVPMDATESLPSEVSSVINATDLQVAARKFRKKKCIASGVRSDEHESIFRNKVSVYRGVTRHKVSKRYEAHIWDNSVRIEGKTRKGRLVYLGGYNREDDAARAYDLAVLKYYGTSESLNFPLQNYKKELEEMKNMTKVDFVASLRRKSDCFARGASVYRGVSRHRQPGKWQARIAKVGGYREDLFLGIFSTEVEAAEAYDIAAIKFKGVQAVTNFGIRQYDVSYIAERVTIPITNVRAAKRVKESEVPNATGNGDETIASNPHDLHGSSSMPTFEQPQPSPVPQPQENPQQFHQDFTDNQNQLHYPNLSLLHSSQQASQINQNFTDTQTQLPHPNPSILNFGQEPDQLYQNPIDVQNSMPDTAPSLLSSSQDSNQLNQNITDSRTQFPDINSSLLDFPQECDVSIDLQNCLPDNAPSVLNSNQESNHLKVTDTEMQLSDLIPSLLDFSEESDQFYLNAIDLQYWFPDTTLSPLITSQESDQLNQNVTDNQTQLSDPTASLLNICQEADLFNQNSIDVQNRSPDTAALSLFISSQESEQLNQNAIDTNTQLPQPTPFSHESDQFNQNSIDVQNWFADAAPSLLNSSQVSDQLKKNVTDRQTHFPQPTPFSQVPDQFNKDSVHVENWLPDVPPSLLNSTQESELNQSYFLDDMMKMGYLSPPTMVNNGSSGSNYSEGHLDNGLLVDANTSLQMNSPAMESQSDLGLVMSDYNSFEESFHEDSSLPWSPLWNDVTTI